MHNNYINKSKLHVPLFIYMQVIDIFNNNLIFQNTFMTFWQILILPYFTKTSVKLKKNYAL